MNADSSPTSRADASKKPRKLQAVRGMNDLLPTQVGAWHRVEQALREVAWGYGYQEIRTPIVEHAELFAQSIGDDTDIVAKEMYAFTDAGDAKLALRPEATASTVRACNQHGLLHNQCARLWYLGPMFRRERPQKGRYRQFHQFGIEAFGWFGPDIDAEVIRVGARIWEVLGITGVSLQLNTLGSRQTRALYRRALQDYLRDHRQRLDADSVKRLETNPLRVLDSKDESTKQVVADAPDILSFLDDDARAHFDGLCESLHQSGIAFRVNPHLVRGLDYYTGGVFEWVTDELGAQNAVCAGGRYDSLVASRGGRATPGVGFALGLERVIELAQAQRGDSATATTITDIYVAHQDASAQAVEISERLRRAGLKVTMHCGGGKLQKQLKRADASGARLAIIADAGATARVKRLDLGEQQSVEVDQIATWCREHLQPINPEAI
ncbi:MAG: histidine--tRNA ligase [bacterium]